MIIDPKFAIRLHEHKVRESLNRRKSLAIGDNG